MVSSTRSCPAGPDPGPAAGRTDAGSSTCRPLLPALHRGAYCTVDLSDGLDIFAHRDQPLEDVRAELGVPR
jgi:hypothetical protein